MSKVIFILPAVPVQEWEGGVAKWMGRWVDGGNEEGRKSGETTSRSPMTVVVTSKIEGLKEKECFLMTVLPGNDLILVLGRSSFS